MSKYTNSTLESLELQRSWKNHEIRRIDIVNYRAKQHGFVDHSNFHNKLKFVVYSMIQLKIDYNPTVDLESRYDRVNSLLEQYKNTELKCACCGESHIEFLTIDHINNDGAEHKNKLGHKYRGSILQNIFSKGFKASDYQILCLNCNTSLGGYGYCPHHPEIIRKINSGRPLKNKTLL